MLRKNAPMDLATFGSCNFAPELFAPELFGSGTVPFKAGMCAECSAIQVTRA
jgi:hypothetical protein